MLEEAEACTHASKGLNKALKTSIVIGMLFLLTMVEFGCVNAITDGQFLHVAYWLAMFCDVFSLTFPGTIVAIYTRLPLQMAQLLGTLPFLLMIFFSTTFSPGSGVAVVKELRYLFPRFYFWCMLPGIQEEMDGCPSTTERNTTYLVLSSLVGVAIFGTCRFLGKLRKRTRSAKKIASSTAMVNDPEFQNLQGELFRFDSGKEENSLPLACPPGDTASEDKPSPRLSIEETEFDDVEW
jgi:hypothetical protein